MTPNPWYRRSSFKSLWKQVTALVVAALSGLTTWKAAGVGAAIAALVSSYDILFGEESYPPAPPMLPPSP